MKVQKGDFVEIGFIGRIKDNNLIFDLTDEKVAKENSIYDPRATYTPIIICLGEGHVVPGLDKELIGKEIGKKYSIELKPEEGFGKKDPKLFQLVNTNKFKKQDIKPFPGMQVNVDNMMGVVKSVSGGRTLIDFNHPLAGKELVYEVNILKKIENDEEKLDGFLKIVLNRDIKSEVEDGNAKIELELPEQIKKVLEDKIKALIPCIKQLSFKLANKK